MFRAARRGGSDIENLLSCFKTDAGKKSSGIFFHIKRTLDFG